MEVEELIEQEYIFEASATNINVNAAILNYIVTVTSKLGTEDFSYSIISQSYVTATKSGNTLTITIPANTSTSSTKSGTVVLKQNVSNKTITIKITQSKDALSKTTYSLGGTIHRTLSISTTSTSWNIQYNPKSTGGSTETSMNGQKPNGNYAIYDVHVTATASELHEKNTYVSGNITDTIVASNVTVSYSKSKLDLKSYYTAPTGKYIWNNKSFYLISSINYTLPTYYTGTCSYLSVQVSIEIPSSWRTHNFNVSTPRTWGVNTGNEYIETLNSDNGSTLMLKAFQSSASVISANINFYQFSVSKSD